MTRTRLVPTVLFVTMFAAKLDAQRLAPAILGSPTNITTPTTSTFLRKASDYRWEGLIAGAIILGFGGAFFGSRLCQLSESLDKHCFRTAVGLGLLGAFGGGIIGGVIGGVIPKPPETPP